AHKLYENAYEYAQNTDSESFFKIERNYLESCLQLDKNIDSQLETLKNRNIPNSTVNYLELDSFKTLKNSEKCDNLKDKEAAREKAKEEILNAYFIAKNNDIVNDNLYYKAALVLSSDSQFDESSIICKTRLDKLKKENKTFTHEFLNYLTLLGVNNTYHVLESSEAFDRAKNTLENALEIEKEVKDPTIKEEIIYNLLKIDYAYPDKDTIFKRSSEFIENSTNAYHQKEICKSASNFAIRLGNERLLTLAEGEELARPYFEKMESILQNEEGSEKELIELYIYLKKLYPSKEAEYTQKINKLNNNHDLPIKEMIANIKLDLANNNEEKLQKFLNNVIQDSNIDETRKNIAKNYKLLLKINKGVDFQQSTNELVENINNLYYNHYKKDSSNKILAEHIYDTYNRLSNIQYNAGQYASSANTSDRVDEIAKDLNLPQAELEKLKVYSTLRNYKAKYYVAAENRCLEFLEMISGVAKYDAQSANIDRFISGKTDEQCKKIASTLETLGIINLKNFNFNDSKKYYQKAIDLREKLSSKDIYLANDYAALARLAILDVEFFGMSSKEMHNKCLEILDDKFPNSQITQEEHAFHKKYYGCSLTSLGKFIGCRDDNAIIDKFKCYNRELNICE
ncbi:MAG: hypothetical protein NC191_08550, partial [Muribaculaceae bacterium]|nr:hypothetical protein [Muribaculaceae bacterium]